MITDDDKKILSMLDGIGKENSTCRRGKCAAIFAREININLLPHHDMVRDEKHDILSVGYVGVPTGTPNCIDDGDLMEERIRYLTTDNPQYRNQDNLDSIDSIEVNGVLYIRNTTKHRFQTEARSHCVRTVHAEMDAIIRAASIGVSLNGSTLYVSMTPCRNCAMSVIMVGVKRVVCNSKYHAGKESEIIFQQNGIPIEFLNDEIAKY